ncbi:hypothetical protein DFH06DRAFT_1178942 [Mycena polygramma]|nr:hypothetical protein DFH06DRAFT_1178942 [Mycena polygramma]
MAPPQQDGSLSSGIPGVMQAQPTLPLELERYTFELAALFRPVSIPTMMRVAWRVKIWIEPLLYRTLIIGADKLDGLPICPDEKFNQIVDTKPQLLVSVRNVLAVGVESDMMKTIFSRCRGVENLVLIAYYSLSGPSPPPGFQELSLRRLHCDLDGLYNLRSVTTLAVPPLLHLTHLELISEIDFGCRSPAEHRARWNLLAGLPNLTHLALSGLHQLPMCSHLLTVCEFLTALVVLSPAPHPGSVVLDLIPSNDPRFVVLSLKFWPHEWPNGVLRGIDFWSRADVFIAQRISGEIERTTFFLNTTS